METKARIRFESTFLNHFIVHSFQKKVSSLIYDSNELHTYKIAYLEAL